MTPLIRIHSFGYHKSGPPADPHGHGGGHVFDCRALPNPGREQRFVHLTGLDPEVRRFFEGASDVAVFIQRCVEIIGSSAHSYRSRGYGYLYVAFGCTGGQHRSVYCAEQAAAALRVAGFATEVSHCEREFWP
jgi:RNase adapter protein RapZ